MEARKIKKVGILRALAHPLRLRLLYALSAERAATASKLAEVVDESPALVSYHLRQLAAYGFVEEAPDLVQDQRQRWWRPSSQGFQWTPSDFGSAPESRMVASTVKRLLLQNQLDRLRQFEDEQPAWGNRWTDAAFSSDSLLRLTAEETQQLQKDLQAVIRRWSRRDEAVDGETSGPGVGRENVMVLMHGFPFRP